MCNHTYSTKKNIKYKGNPKPPCFFNSIRDNTDYFSKGLLHDSEGKCIFHSEDIKWKSENHFCTILLNTIDKLNQDDAISEIDLDEIIIADANAESFLIQIKTAKNFTMNKTKVFNILSFDAASFKGQFFCKEAIFHSKVEIRNTTFKSIGWEKSVFKKAVVISKCHFRDYTSFDNAVFEESLKVEETCFEGMTFFAEAKFLEKGHFSWVIFQDVTFKKLCVFDKCFSACSFLFRKVLFEGETDFKEAVFSKVQNHSNYGVEPYSFKQIGLGKNAVLSFMGVKNRNDIFQDQVEFDFVDNMEGKVIFDNMNFRFIIKKSRDEILKLEKLGKIEIGPGCIKYRHQTDLKEVGIGTDGQQIILEIARTFTNYFISHNGVNLGIEVLEKTEDKLIFFYYTDEDITAEEFYDMLQSTEEHLWSSLLLNQRKDSTELVTKNPSQMKKYFDGMTSLRSIFQKIGFRIALKEWRDVDTKYLVAALELGGKIPFSSGDLHLLISKSSMVENIKGFLDTYSYRNLHAEKTSQRLLANPEKVVDVLKLENLLLKDEFAACIDTLAEISENIPELQPAINDLSSYYKRIEEDKANGELSKDDYEALMSILTYKTLQFIDLYDSKFNAEITKEGIAVAPGPAAKVREMGLDAPNLIHLAYEKIVYISSLSQDKNYAEFYTKKGRIFCKKISLSQLVQMLPENFLRIEKSYILNMKFWEGTRAFKKAFLHEIVSEKKEIPIGRQYVDTLKKYLNQKYHG